ncbi:MAG TPA: hypothetical protein ENK19_04840, partial [Acidobacteria bacterium]|nr:hypothetical protein [Acidobacteriota bacterium]
MAGRGLVTGGEWCSVPTMRTNRWVPWLLALTILLALWGPFVRSVVHDLPFGFHAWKQADCLALAQRYLEDDNWNLLVSRTQNLIPVDARVNAELPLVPYLAAVLARVLGRSHLAAIFRLLTVLFAALAPLGIFGLVWGTRGVPESVLATVFVAACPVLVYYGAGFHPDPPAFGVSILGLSLVLGWRPDRPPGDATVSLGISLMGLGGLLKMSMAPYLAVPAVLLLHRARRRGPDHGLAAAIHRLPRRPVIALAAAFTLCVAQVVALRTVAAAYHSPLFTADLHPFRSFADL